MITNELNLVKRFWLQAQAVATWSLHIKKNLSSVSDADREIPTLGLGFLDLHRRPMIDYFSYLFLNKIVLFP